MAGAMIKAESAMNKKSIVRLTDAEREQLTELTRKGKAAASKDIGTMTLHVAGRVACGLRCLRGDAPDLAGVHRDVEGASRVGHQRADALAGQVHPRVARRPARGIEVQDLEAPARQEAHGQAPLPGTP